MNTENMRQQLIERVKENYAGYRANLLLKDRQELIDSADRIAKTAEVFQYFTEHRLTEPEMAYFLKFQNPLEVAADHWNDCDFELDALEALIADVVDRGDDLTLYPLAAELPEVQQESKPEGTMDRDEHDVVELLGITALFLNERVHREDVPEGLYRYDLRGSDDDPGDPAAVENHVAVNHAGTILTATPLDIPEKGFLALDDGLNFTGDEMTVVEFKDKYARPELLEAVYLVDRTSLLHLKEVQGGDFEYAVFNKQTREKVTEGRIVEDDVLDGIDPIHDHLAAARDAAIGDAGLHGGPLGGSDVAQVGLTSLKNFPMSDIYRRSIWEPDTLPKDDLRFINSDYQEQFRLSNGGRIEVEYPDHTFSLPCEYIDDYHAFIAGEVYHMCQFAEILERNGGVCRPEAVLDAEQAAWRVGVRAYLAVECGAGHWGYKLFDDKFNLTKSGELEVVGCSINEVRDMILAENKLEHRSMTPTDHGLLMAKVAQVGQERAGQNVTPAHKPSIKEQLAAKPVPSDRPTKPKDREAR